MMKQFKLTILLTILVSTMGIDLFAHDISVRNADGVTIYYKWIKGKTGLVVSYRGNKYYDYSDEYTGNVVIPESAIIDGKSYRVTSIGDEAFRGCSGLTSVTIPKTVNIIDVEAFYRCSGLTSITIPNSVIRISRTAFQGCRNLTSIIVENGNEAYDSRNNCNAIIETATNELIVGCRKTVIPNSVTSIGSEAFRYCSGLTSITIPNSVTHIGFAVFQGCSNLTSVYIDNFVLDIGEMAFTYLDNYPRLYFFGSIPPVIYYNTFDSSVDLYVNEESIWAYMKAPVWQHLGMFSLTSFNPTVINTVSETKAKENSRYSIDGQHIGKPKKGVNIIKMSDGSTKKVLVKE